MKNNLAKFFTCYRVWETSGNILLGSKRFYSNPCAGFKIICVTPKRLLKTQTFEKEKLFFKRKIFFGRFFSRIIKYEKPQKTNYKGTPGIVIVVLQVIRAFLSTYEVDGNNFSTKANFQKKNTYWPITSRITDSRVSQTSSNILIGSTRSHSNNCAGFKIISITP